MKQSIDLPDELNPQYMFQTTAIKLLSQIAKGEIDAVDLAKRELASQGRDINGVWVGFGKAVELLRIS